MTKRQWWWRQAELEKKAVMMAAGRTWEKSSEGVGVQNCTKYQAVRMAADKTREQTGRMVASRTVDKAVRMVASRTVKQAERMAAGKTGVTMAASKHKAAKMVTGRSV
jgi:hypothetical protein